VAPTGFYRAAWNGCEAASAGLSAKWSSRAARRSASLLNRSVYAGE